MVFFFPIVRTLFFLIALTCSVGASAQVYLSSTPKGFPPDSVEYLDSRMTQIKTPEDFLPTDGKLAEGVPLYAVWCTLSEKTCTVELDGVRKTVPESAVAERVGLLSNVHVYSNGLAWACNLVCVTGTGQVIGAVSEDFIKWRDTRCKQYEPFLYDCGQPPIQIYGRLSRQ